MVLQWMSLCFVELEIQVTFKVDFFPWVKLFLAKFLPLEKRC